MSQPLIFILIVWGILSVLSAMDLWKLVFMDAKVPGSDANGGCMMWVGLSIVLCFLALGALWVPIYLFRRLDRWNSKKKPKGYATTGSDTVLATHESCGEFQLRMLLDGRFHVGTCEIQIEGEIWGTAGGIQDTRLYFTSNNCSIILPAGFLLECRGIYLVTKTEPVTCWAYDPTYFDFRDIDANPPTELNLSQRTFEVSSILQAWNHSLEKVQATQKLIDKHYHSWVYDAQTHRYKRRIH